MRNLKRFIAGAAALAMALGMTLSVSAAEVPSPTPEDGGYVVIDPIDDKGLLGVDSDSKAAIQDVQNGATAETFANTIKGTSVPGAADVAKELEGKEWLTKFFDLRIEPDGYQGVPDANFNYTFTIKGIGSYSKDEITVVHYSVEKPGWEVLEIVKIEGDNVTVHYNSLSPTAFAVLAKTSEETSTSSVSSASSSKTSSPKTGVAAGWELYMLAAAALAGCGVSFSRKKKG